jgi:hypothetical protein
VIKGTSTETLNPAVVSSDNQCTLGKWIYGEGAKQFGSKASYAKVVAAHAQFHQCAGKTLKLALEGKTKDAEFELNSGAFPRASLEVTMNLMQLWREGSAK